MCMVVMMTTKSKRDDKAAWGSNAGDKQQLSQIQFTPKDVMLDPCFLQSVGRRGE